MEDISLICVPPNDLLYILKKQTSPPPIKAAATWLRLSGGRVAEASLCLFKGPFASAVRFLSDAALAFFSLACAVCFLRD